MAAAIDPEVLARRARREERRAKQREQTILRAAKMHAARLAAERAKPLPVAPRRATRSSVHIGCSGWFYWHWRECFYPPDQPTSKWFAHYARQFNTVELNAPFYSWPTVANVATWTRQVKSRRGFQYAIKVSELITHRKRFVGCKTLVRDFGFIADLLGERFGCFLFQLPPSVHYSPAMLRRVVTSLDPRRTNVVEFRHRSWWNENVYRAFHESGTIFCSCSGPRLPDELIKTADDIYVRFHGTTQWYRHDYSREELAVWATRIGESNASRAWCYFNNDRECHAIKNAKMLKRLLASARRDPAE